MTDTFRKTTLTLTAEQQKTVNHVKDVGDTIFNILDTHTTGDTDRRLVDNAKNQIEIAVMLAVKVITGP